MFCYFWASLTYFLPIFLTSRLFFAYLRFRSPRTGYFSTYFLAPQAIFCLSAVSRSVHGLSLDLFFGYSPRRQLRLFFGYL